MQKHYGKMKKSYYDTMEIIVSNFMLDSLEEGVWGRAGGGKQDKKGEEKWFFLCSCFSEKNFPSLCD